MTSRPTVPRVFRHSGTSSLDPVGLTGLPRLLRTIESVKYVREENSPRRRVARRHRLLPTARQEGVHLSVL